MFGQYRRGGRQIMREELRSSLEGLRHEYDKQFDDLRKMQHDMREINATARTRDGLVTVTVDARGHVTDIRLDPRVHDRLTPQRLARELMSTISQAMADASEQTQRLMAPFMPGGIPAESTLGEDFDVTDFLPHPSMFPGEPPEGEYR
jgi:DNA-binding protein YbaB